MKHEDIQELHNIVSKENICSIMEKGILSHRRAATTRHRSIAKPGVQDRRGKVQIPGGGPLHEYANLYFNARNPMLYSRRELHEELCVLRISPDVLTISGVVIADCNAAGEYVRFGPPTESLSRLKAEVIFAKYWTHQNSIEQQWHTAKMCAEVLVPDRVDPVHIVGAYVSCEQSRFDLQRIVPSLPIRINLHIFFL